MPGSPERVLTRWQAAGLHLLASLALAVVVALLLFGVWYPPPYTRAAGADHLIMLLIGIDLALGPLLTLIVYKHGKWGMRFDIVVIAVVQMAALIYGMHVIAQSRPVFVVVARDMTYLTMASALSDADLAAAPPPFNTRSWLGPVLVAAPPPDTAAERLALLESGLGGKDIDQLPKHYRSMEQAGAALIAASTPLQKLADVTGYRAMVEAFVAKVGLPMSDLRFQPLRGRDPEHDQAMVFAVGQLQPVGMIPVDPWPALSRSEE